MSTRVVSWNDAAEMNESVESDAFVMPSSSGRPVAGRPPSSITRSFSSSEAEPVDLLVEQELGVADVLDLHPAQHLADDHFDVLVVDVHALQAVDLLDLVDQVLLQLLLAEHVQDVVRVERAVHQRLAGAHALAFLHVDVHAARDASTRAARRRRRTTMILRWPLTIGAVLDDAVDLAT